MKSVNSYQGGMSSDGSNLKASELTYLSAENFRLVSLEGRSTLALENTKGTSIAFKLPDTVYAVYKIDPQNPLYTGNVDIQINSNFGGPHPIITISNIQNYSAKQLAEELLSNTTILSQVNAGHYTIQYNNSYVVLVGLDNPIVPLIAYNFGPGILCELLAAEITNPNIIGAINIKDTVVIFSTDCELNPDTTDVASSGQIWTMQYDEDTNTIAGLVNSTLVPSVHLKYHNNVDFTRFRKISGEGVYERSNYQPVTFTDNFNLLRLFNVASDNTFATPLEVLDIKPLHSTSVPVIQNISDGGFIPNGRIQYFYQLLSDLGTVTTYSTASNLISLTNSPLNASYQAYQGGSMGTISGKSITIKIEGLDTNFDSIKVGYILWEAEDAATVKLFFEGRVPPSGEIQLTHSGASAEISSTLSFYRSLQAAFDICKGVKQKKNILLAYNTRNIPFDIDIDCRAYRFHALIGPSNAFLYDKEDTYGNPRFLVNRTTKALSTYGVSSGDWTDIPEEADLINPYNNEGIGSTYDPSGFNNNDWISNSQFKYKADGITLGGEGPIVSYEFIDNGGPSSNFSDYGDVFQVIHPTSTVYGNPLVSGISGANLNYTPGNGYTYPVSGGFNSMKNPELNSLFYGYSSGEVYRFGIVFYNKRFQPSFVKWIGDIKFPMVTDGFHLFEDTINKGGSLNGNIYMKQMGIKFTLDVSQLSQDIKDNISGWSFVRVKRDVLNRTRLGTGLLNSIDTVTAFGADYYCIYNGTGFSPNIHPDNNNNNDYATYESANFKFGIGNNFAPGDHIRYLYAANSHNRGEWLTGTTNVGVSYYYEKYHDYSITSVFPISNMYEVPVAYNKNIISADSNLDKPFINMGQEASDEFKEWGGLTHLLSSKSEISDLFIIPPVPTTTSPYPKSLVSYERYLSNQYGLQWEERSNQTYIGTTHFQPWDNTQTIIATDVYGGDTLRTVFDFMRADRNDTINNKTSGFIIPGTIRGTIQIFPCEVFFDLHLRQGAHSANKSGAAGESDHEDFIYNTAYSQENTSQIFLTKPYNFNAIEENPTRIWASQEKFSGEFPNAWSDWRADEYIDVETSFGAINSIGLITDKPVFYQDYAVGWISVKEQVTISPENQAQTVLGTGEVLARYDYISKLTGSKHQWAVIETPKGLYHFDATLKKVFFLHEKGNLALSDLKGLNSYLQKNLLYSVKDLDIPLIKGGISIHGEYNPRFNQIFFTVLDGYNQHLNNPESNNTNTLTVAYNELTDCFDSFHSFKPSMYHRTENRLWSIYPRSDVNLYSKTMFEHDTGLYNTYYGTLYPSKLSIVINPAQYSIFNKRLDILEFITEVTTITGIDVPLQTVSTIRVFDNYQDTGIISLTPQVNIKKKFRTWKFNTLRNFVDRARLRDKTFTVELTFNNPGNNRIVLHDIASNFELNE